ncbi:MAG: hypothetical protein A3G13_02110 [Candidatus Levybacteria bacterium RIFCSPLOWO2_12_FULL_37_7]|nr:MAG: hypothetical protein A2770_02505 [Candidatus Levybacteria bacterium RIFCSPHIGHO2_01_FULL_38_12]OGH52492.1 MAG: hypothetical protein A3G13_02110 [Candidatus Levybacteria bacterium RIFCSPLOWO2_12_FULL_37_7]
MNKKLLYCCIVKLLRGKRSFSGFTMIEIMIVIGIVSVLSTMVLVVFNPSKKFSQAYNTKRRTDINSLLNAINQYAADNKGALPSGISTSTQIISNTGANICLVLVPQYIASLPVDPLTNNGTPIATCSGSFNTNYTASKSATNNRVTVSAPAAELGEIISVTR